MKIASLRVEIKQLNLQENFSFFAALFARLMETARLLKGDNGLGSDAAGYGERI